MNLLNIIWPAIYVYQELEAFGFFVFVTIFIETCALWFMLKYSFQQSLLASIVGNLVSGLVGSFVMMWGMVLWHALADRFVPDATFGDINWVATFVLMCLGSVLIETLAVKLLFKDTIKRLFLPLLIGNLLTYGYIGYSMDTSPNDGKDPREHRKEQVIYSPRPNVFTLLDSTKLHLLVAKTHISYGVDGQVLNTGYSLEIPFEREDIERFQFSLSIPGKQNSSGMEAERTHLYSDSLTDTIRVILKQKNPDPEKGWTAPIVTDTILFIKQ